MAAGSSNRPAAPGGQGAGEPAGGEARKSKARARPLVLVVEDNPYDWEIYGKILWYNGYDVLYAPNAEAGYELAWEHVPDLILLDLMLPSMDGFGFCRRIREEPKLSDVAIVVLSGLPYQQAGQTALDLGCRAYLEKPISPVDVLHRVEELIGRAPPSGVGDPPRKYPPDA
jgi:two-component system cell cycle response regulator DivK